MDIKVRCLGPRFERHRLEVNNHFVRNLSGFTLAIPFLLLGVTLGIKTVSCRGIGLSRAALAELEQRGGEDASGTRLAADGTVVSILYLAIGVLGGLTSRATVGVDGHRYFR
jgi:hypothetical protein